jgi:putative membrane protein
MAYKSKYQKTLANYKGIRMGKVLPEKLDIDIRFLLANERTLLAWVRTSLVVEVGGVALIQIHRYNPFIGGSILLLGAVVALIGYHRYRAADRAIRDNRVPAGGAGPALQVIAVVAIAIAISIAQFVFMR